MSDLKDRIKDAFTVNGRLNYELYRRLGKNGQRMTELLDQFGKLDSIADVEPLREYRASIERGEDVFFTTDANRSNMLIYGIWHAMFGSHADTPAYLLPAVEHGLIFSNQVFTDVRFTARPGVVTQGPFRKAIIQRYRKVPVFTVGPYITYASSYYDSEKQANMKRDLGKTLLVFPAHGTDDAKVDCNQERYIREVREVARDFDTVLVNAYWWNINDPIIDAFASEGFKIVSAGIRDDIHFLQRLRTLIEVSDLVVGDSISTHVGYCLALKVPYMLIEAETAYRHSEGSGYLAENALHQSRLAVSFIGKSAIDENQMEGCRSYWGLGVHRSLSELVDICCMCEAIAREAHYSTGNYMKAALGLCESDDLTSAQRELLGAAL